MNSTHKQQTIDLIKSISEQVKKLLDYNENAPLIEVDIVKANLIKLYENVDKINSKTEVNFVEDTKAESIDNEINDLLDIASKEFKAEQDTLLLEQEEVLNQQVEDEEIIAEITENIEEESASEIKIEEKNEPLSISRKPNIIEKDNKDIDKNVSDRKIIHILEVAPDDEEEEVLSKNKSLMSDTLKKKAIKSLKQGIGINDKFMIINDLFEGRAKDFNAAIKELDNQESNQAAIFLLEDMKDENSWEIKDRAYIQFKSYIERRYMQ